MENVYDLKISNNLAFIISESNSSGKIELLQCNKLAIILYLYYEDTLENYLKFIENIQNEIDVYIITSNKNVTMKMQSSILKRYLGRNSLIEKPNVGRDISGLLIAAKPIVEQYEYVCFVHDKKAHNSSMEKDTAFWIENIWGNMIGSLNYVNQVIDLMVDNKELGVLVPPAPVGDHFCTWYGYGWHGSFNATKKLAECLGLNCDLNEEKPPITIGTALWFKTKAMRKLFDYPWKYEDFDDDKLKDTNYVSFGVERIFAYVAQDAGFLTGEVMSLEYAQKQMLYLQYSMTEIFKQMQPFYPFPTYDNALHLGENLNNLLKNTVGAEEFVLYGAGDVGRFCARYLKMNGINVSAFIVSREEDIKEIDNIPLISVDRYVRKKRNAKIIITVIKRSVQEQMIQILRNYSIDNYYIFWNED